MRFPEVAAIDVFQCDFSDLKVTRFWIRAMAAVRRVKVLETGKPLEDIFERARLLARSGTRHCFRQLGRITHWGKAHGVQAHMRLPVVARLGT